jgi:predicted nucleic acid-binding protein
MRFLDTNIILRLITGDDPTKADACRRLVLRLDTGEEEALCSESVIAEVFFILTSPRQYRLPRSEVTDRVRPIVELRGLRFPSKQLILKAIDAYATYSLFDFEDALSLAHMEAARLTEVYSYDRDFDRIEGVTRIEPAP